MPRFSIPESDQREFGAPAILEWNVVDITVEDLEWLSERFGFDPSDWPTPLNGELTLEQAGDPDARPKPPPWRPRALIWTTLRQNGIDVSWERAGKGHFYLWRPVVDESVSPGKDSTEETPSPASAASTTPRSRTSTGSRRRKST
jgi:hypothetical protein